MLNKKFSRKIGYFHSGRVNTNLNKVAFVQLYCQVILVSGSSNYREFLDNTYLG